MFGLSYKQYLEEPLEEFQVNSLIQSIINQIEERKLKKTGKNG